MLRIAKPLKTDIVKMELLVMSRQNPNVTRPGFEKEICEIHRCMRHVMKICRWIGLFPVEGLDNESPHKLKFNLRSPYTVYFLLTIIGFAVNTLISIIYVFNAANLTTLAYLIFNVSIFISGALLYKLSRLWSSIMKKATHIEILTEIRISRNTYWKTKFAACIGILIAVCEHILHINYIFSYIGGCIPNKTMKDIVFNFLHTKMPFSSNNVYFDLCVQVYLEIATNQATILWFYTDVIIICFSICLIAYFGELNKEIYNKKNNNSTNWRKLREKYGYLVQLLDVINYNIRWMVLLSCFCNMFAMCIQLFNAMRISMDDRFCNHHVLNPALDGMNHHVYYGFSLSLTVLMTFTMSLLAAHINTLAKQPLIYLSDIHSSVYNIEIERFYRQINYTTIGLSGVFFTITRSTILKVVGTMVTYELLLIQLSQIIPSTDHKSLNISLGSNAHNINGSAYLSLDS